MAESIMGESFLAAHLEHIVARSDEIPPAFERASQLQDEAKALRANARKAHAHAFELASDTLLDHFYSGKISDLQAVGSIANLEDLDPALVRLHGKRGSKIVSAFAALQCDTPVIDLAGQERSYTGIVTAPAQVREMHARTKSGSPAAGQTLMAPWGTLDVPLRTLDHDGEAQDVVVNIEISSLALATIGRIAIQDRVQNSQFTTKADKTSFRSGTVNNAHTLNELRAQIDILQKLGEEPVDTSSLDREIARARSYKALRFDLLRVKAKRRLGQR